MIHGILQVFSVHPVLKKRNNRMKPCLFWIFLLTGFQFFSCTAPIDIQTRNSEPVPVIYGYLTDEVKNQYIRITKSSPYFQEAENQFISNAKVWVTSSTGREYPFLHDANGFYVSQRRFSAVPNVTYHLSVEIDFMNDGVIELYEAETTMLPKVLVDSINVTSINIMGFLHYSLNIFMQEPPETDNYYLFKYFINDTISNDKISDLIIADDEMINGEYIDGVSIRYFNAASDQEEIDDDWGMYYVNPGDRIRLQILNIEKGYYTFIRDCSTEKYGSNPFFGGPPSNIHTNLSNGAIGYFSSYGIQAKVAIVSE